MSTIQARKLKSRLAKGSLPSWTSNVDIDNMSDAQCGKVFRDIKTYDADNKQSHLSSDVRGGKRRRRRRRTRKHRRKSRKGRKSRKRRRTKRRRRRR